MVSDTRLPWFLSRMTEDTWSFGIMLVTGQVLAIQTIYAVRRAQNGSAWIDAQLMPHDDFWIESARKNGYRVVGAPTSREHVSINIAHIVAAFELADT